MRVKWSSDAAQSILWQLREAEQNMNDCIRDAASGRQALEDANPDAQSRTLNQLMAEFEEALNRLKGYSQELSDLVRITEDTKNRFEDAERSVSGMIDRIATGADAEAPGYCPPLPPIPDYIRIEDAVFGWTVPMFDLLPTMRINDPIPAPAWFESLLNDQDFFTTLMDR